MGNTNGTGTTEEFKSRVLNTIVLILVLGALAVAPSQYSFGGEKGIPYITPADVLIALAFVAWLVYLVAFRRYRSLRFPPEFGLYVAWAVAASIIAVTRETSPGLAEVSAPGVVGILRCLLAHPCIKETIQLAAYFVLAPLLFANVLKHSDRLRAAAYVFLAAGTAVVVHALVQGLQVPLLEIGGADSEHAVRALFANNHVLSAYLAMLAPMCIAVLFFWPGPLMKIWAGLLAAASVVLSFSGGAILALVVSVLAVAAMRGRRHVGYVVFAAIVLFGVVFSYFPSDRMTRIHDSVSLYTKWGDTTIVSYRYRRWQSGLNIFRTHPIVGVGHGMFQEHVGKQKYHMLDDGETPTPTPPEDVTISKKFIDNRYILTAAELGLPGFMLLVTILILACRRAMVAAADTTDPRMKALLVGCFGIIVSASIAADFTDVLVRGLALPLMFAACAPVWWAADQD